MKKKLFLVFLVLVSTILISCVATHTADSVWHNDDNHHWHECSQSGCDELFDKGEHTWSEWTETKPATCKQVGEKTRECTVCKKTEVEIIERLAHTDADYTEKYDDSYHWLECSVCNQIKENSKVEHSFTNYVDDNNASCSSNGTKTAKCDGCSKTDTKEIADTMTDHTFTNYVPNDDATCTSNGTETAKCDGCDEIHTREIANSMVAHEMSPELLQGEDTHYNKCLNCDYKENEEEHDWAEWDVLLEPTFDEEGLKSSVCQVCNYEAEVVIPVLAKADLIVLSDITKSLHIGEDFNLVATIGPANATNYRVEWTVEDSSIVSLAPDGNSCKVTSNGVLGRTIITLEVINELNGEEIYKYDVNCTVSVIEKPIVHYTFNDGKIENIGSNQNVTGNITTLSKDNKIIDGSNEVEFVEGTDGVANSALKLSQKRDGGNHFTINGLNFGTGDFTIKTKVYVTGIVEKDGATYLFGTGNETDSLGNIKDVKAPYFNVTFKNNQNKNQVRFVADSKNTQNSTLGKGVYLTPETWIEVTVIRCQNTITLNVTEGAVTYSIVVELSSMEAINFTDLCNLSFSGNYGCQDASPNIHTYYDEIIIYDYAINHMFGEFVSNNDATCSANGTETAKCLDCDLTQTREDLDSMLPHTFTTYVSNNNATCYSNCTETAKCDNCDATDTRDIADSMLDHTFTVYVSNGDGTKTSKCDYCDATDTREEDTSCSHKFAEVYKYNENYHWLPCNKCEEIINPLAHELSEWVVKTAPTFDEDGLQNRSCACGYIEEETISALVAATKVELDSSSLTVYSGDIEEFELNAVGKTDDALEIPSNYYIEWSCNNEEIVTLTMIDSKVNGEYCKLILNGNLGTATITVKLTNIIGEEKFDSCETTFTLTVLKAPIVRYTFDNGEIVNTGSNKDVNGRITTIDSTNTAIVDTPDAEVTYVSGADGSENSALQLSNTRAGGNHFTISGVDLGTNDFTISVKININQLTSKDDSSNYLFGIGNKKDAATGFFNVAYKKNSGKNQIKLRANGATFWCGYAPVGEWVEFRLVRQGNTLSFYINPEVNSDGIKVTEVTLSSTDALALNNYDIGFSSNIGCQNPGDWPAYYDDIMIFDYAIPMSE